MDEYIDEIRIGDLTADERSGEFVLINNMICVLDHSGPEAYARDHHKRGCLFKPYEGLVFEVGEGSFGWEMRKVGDRKLRKATESESARVMRRYREAVEKLAGRRS